jgi:hypothetical protein
MTLETAMRFAMTAGMATTVEGVDTGTMPIIRKGSTLK